MASTAIAGEKPAKPTKSSNWEMPLTATRDSLLRGGSDDALRALVYNIFTMSVRFDQLRERMSAMQGLAGIQYHVLMVVAELEGQEPVTVSAVAEKLHTTSAYVTMETGKLLRRGLIEKRKNPDDGRSVLLSLTDTGREAVDAFAPVVQEINDTLFDGIGPETFALFSDIAEHMVGTTGRAVDLADRLAKERDSDTNVTVKGIWR